MESQVKQLTQTSEFFRKSALGIAIVALLVLSPFSINNFLQNRIYLGIGSFIIVVIMAFNAWSISKHNRYYPLLILLGLVPAILVFLYLSIDRQGMIGFLWCYPSVVAFYFLLPEKKAWIANFLLFVMAFPKAWLMLERGLAARMIMTLVGVSFFSAIFVRVITEQQNKLQEQATIDPLTGVFNRTLLGETLEQATLQSQRADVPMTLVAIDLDHFKKINDNFGHEAGDVVLRGVGKILNENCRRTDKVFRLGGEEFLLFLYGATKENGRQYAEKLRGIFETKNFIPEKQVTVSIGIAEYESGEKWKDWMKRADEKLYLAKTNGRNRVEF